MKTKNKGEIIIYQAPSGAIELQGDFKEENLWATQSQIVNLFNIDQSVVSRHINNIFKNGEIDKKSNMQKMHIANSDKPVAFYSLDVVLGVGYRANSKVAIEFRKWATKTLRGYITKGFVINPKRIKENYEEFQKAIEGMKKLLPKDVKIDNESVLELVSAFADTWLSLEAYDEDNLVTKGVTKKSVKFTGEQMIKALGDFKLMLQKKKEATDLFGQEKNSGEVNGIFGNVMQTFGGKELYPTLEEKAAHLLYFMVKNHPYVDGNKRSGAYSFIWFLQSAKILDRSKITPATLTALTLFIAESQPKNKDKMIKLVLQLLKK